MQPKPIRVGAWELHHHVLKPSRCLLQTHAVRLHTALQRPHDFVTFVCSSHPPTPHPPPDDAAVGRVTVHRVLLDAAGAPLRSLVSGPFKEASANTITVHERFDSFDVVRKFLHCEPINLDNVPPELPLVADRWGLTTLFRACFTHAEERARRHNDTPRIHIAELVTRFLPIMAIVDVPSRFKTYMAMRMAIEMKELNAYFRDNSVHIPPLCRDAVCSLRHPDGVQCRRKKSAVLTDDMIPATHVANPIAQPVPDVLESEESKPAEDENAPHSDAKNANASNHQPTKSHELSSNSLQTSKKQDIGKHSTGGGNDALQDHASQASQNGHLAESDSVGGSQDEKTPSSSDDAVDRPALEYASGEGSSEAPEKLAPRASPSLNAEKIVESTPKPAVTCALEQTSHQSQNHEENGPSVGHAIQLDDKLSTEQRETQSTVAASSSSAEQTLSQQTRREASAELKSNPAVNGSSSASPAEGVEEASQTTSADKAEAEHNETGNDQPDEGNTDPCAHVDAAQPESRSSAADQTTTVSNATGDESGDGEAGSNVNADDEVEASTAAEMNTTVENEACSIATADADFDANGNPDDVADADAGSNADDNSNTDVESVVADSASVAASEESELPLYEIDPEESKPKEWHKTFNVWNVFHQRNMLDDVIHFMSNYGCDNYIPLLLDVILRQLEPTLSDEEILHFLRKCDWVWEAPEFNVLTDLGNDWGQRAWRLLACARTGYYGKGKEYQMFWNFPCLSGAIRARAADVANKGSDSDSESSHSSIHDESFMVAWGRKVADDEFEFTMSLNISDVGKPWEDLSPLYLKIRLLEKGGSGISPENAKRKVTARVNVIESGCGCVLGGDAPRIGTTVSSSDGTLKCSEIGGFGFMNGGPNGLDGYSYSVMNGEVLKSWLERHTRYCGLAFHVRLHVAPRDEKNSDTSSEFSDEVVDCTCGYCECTGCDQHSEDDKQSNYNSDHQDDAGSSDGSDG
ncbi:unnamed protein product [Agarophyton chilense]